MEADITDNTSSLTHHEKGSIFCLALETAQKIQHAQKNAKNVFLLCSLKYCSWLGPLLMPTPFCFSLSMSVPHGAVHQELSSLFPQTFKTIISPGIFRCATLHGTCKSCHSCEGMSPSSNLAKSSMKLLETQNRRLP